MAKYQLIVRGKNCGHTRGDCVAINLDGDNIAETRRSASLQLYGDKSKWKASWFRDYDNLLQLKVHLNPENAIDCRYGVLLSSEENVVEAWIVKVEESLDIDMLRAEIQQFTDMQKAALKSDPEYQEYLRLEKKFG